MTTQEMKSSLGCTYQQLENGVHELILRQPTRGGIDEMIAHIYNIIATTPNSELTCYMIDNSQVTAPPLNYLAKRIKEVDRKRPADRAPGQIAVLYEGVLGDIANALLALSMKNQIRFFKPVQREAAIEWLLETD